MKKFLTTAILLSFSAASAAAFPLINTNLGGDTVRLDQCIKVGNSAVECSGTIKTKTDGGVFLKDNDFTLISASGNETIASDFTIKGQPHGAVQLRAGIEYPVRMQFRNYTAGSARFFEMNGQRFENVSFAAAPSQAGQKTAPAQNKTANTYNAVLTNCQPAQGNTLVCQAVLIPQR